MIWDPERDEDLPEQVETKGLGVRGLTVRERIVQVLETPGPTLALGGNWWSLADVQDRIRGSSVRSRLQDIMQENRLRPETEQLYEEREISSQVGKAKYKVYRRRPAGAQGRLFDMAPTNPNGR